jgi:ATP-dependent exoDNAse (exonuclease V) alpha subunit
LPDGAPKWATDRAALWNAAEAAERRKDSCVAREVEVALPAELSPAERRRLALDFAKDMANKDGCAIDVAIHAPSSGGDERNWHAHIMRTTRRVGSCRLTGKLDKEMAGRNRREDLKVLRECWADLCNERLQQNNIESRIDHRSLSAQGINRVPSAHLGPHISAILRRGAHSYIQEARASERLAAAALLGIQVRLACQTKQQIICVEIDLQSALKKRESNRSAALLRHYRPEVGTQPQHGHNAVSVIEKVELTACPRPALPGFLTLLYEDEDDSEHPTERPK